MFCMLQSFVPLHSYLTFQAKLTVTWTGVKPCDLGSLGEGPMNVSRGRHYKEEHNIVTRFTVRINEVEA